MSKPEDVSRIGCSESLKDVLSGHGLSADTIFFESGLQRCLTGNVHLGEMSDCFTRAWEIAAQETGDMYIGLTPASHPLLNLGLLSNLLVASPKLTNCVQSVSRYIDLVSPTLAVVWRSNGERWFFEADLKRGRLPVAIQRYDHVVTVLLQGMRWITGRQIAPVCVHMPFPEPAHSERRKEKFGSPVVYGAKQLVVEFTATDMGLAIPTADPILADMCERLVMQAAQRNRSSFSFKVRSVLEETLSGVDPRREVIAAKLCIGERTLQRRLTEEGTSFAELVDQVRRDRAQRLLAHENISLTEMAFELGFSDPSNLYRACKRWFGQTPRALRAMSSQFSDSTISTF